MRALLISTYELGRQPFGLASPAAWLREAGVEVSCLDLSREPFQDDLADADLVAVYLPMHTATRLALPVIRRVRALNPAARLCCYGLYAPLNRSLLQSLGVDHVLGPEFEADLLNVALDPAAARAGVSGDGLPRLAFRVPDRRGLPPLTRYATLQVGDERRTVGYTEGSRGCKHLCRHCPIVPVYQGRFRIVPVSIVEADVRAQVASGARHITFGDPDFFNGIRHAQTIARMMAREFPGVTYDVTIKIEHLLRHRAMLGLLRDTGCLFVTSAVESVDDDVLRRLRKGHSRADFEEVVALCRDHDLTLVPTFVPFTPWTTLDGYCELLDAIERLGLVDAVAPIQVAIRLLVPEGSHLLSLDDPLLRLQPFDEARLIHPWRHLDPRVDMLHEEVSDLVGRRVNAGRPEIFEAIADLAGRRAGRSVPAPRMPVLPSRATVPYLNEPWYC